MKKVAKIHQGKRPVRRHFVKEWAELRNLSGQEIADQLDIDKSQVYRWFKGQMPGRESQERLAALFHIEPEALLRDPDTDWLSRFFEGRDAEERDRIKQAMELAWPKRAG